MSVIDIKSKVDVDQSLTKIARTATVNGASTDISDHNGVSVIIDLGAWTDGTHTFEVQDCDDNSTWVAVATGSLDGTEPVVSDATGDDTKVKIGYLSNKRYLRVIQIVAGASTGLISGVLIVKGFKNVGLES